MNWREYQQHLQSERIEDRLCLVFSLSFICLVLVILGNL
jgi:hypothetical protein